MQTRTNIRSPTKTSAVVANAIATPKTAEPLSILVVQDAARVFRAPIFLLKGWRYLSDISILYLYYDKSADKIANVVFLQTRKRDVMSHLSMKLLHQN